jgi:hypothetical protein
MTSSEAAPTPSVRAGSTKRVASAVREGAAVVAQIHNVLSMESGCPIWVNCYAHVEVRPMPVQ